MLYIVDIKISLFKKPRSGKHLHLKCVESVIVSVPHRVEEK